MTAQQITFEWPHTFIELALILVIAFATRWAANWLIKQIVKAATKKPEELQQSLGKHAGTVVSFALPNTARQAHRTRTLGTLMRSFTDILIIVVTILSILRTLNVDVTPALASAGIGGLAIGFGAQSLIRDVISGAFLIFEDQYGVGDYISVGDKSGTVLNVALRVTQIQDDSGQIWYIRNGEITRLGNMSQGWSSVIVKIPVAISEDPYKVITALSQLCDDLNADQSHNLPLLEPAKVLGLTGFDSTTATYGVLLKTPGNQQWAAERAVRMRAMALFAQGEIQTPKVLLDSDGLPDPTAEGLPAKSNPA